MTILDQIIKQKKIEVKHNKGVFSEHFLKKSTSFSLPCTSLVNRLANNSPGIIAEFKRKSPSKGWINKEAQVRNTVSGYESAGASGVSILTDEKFFGGTLEDIVEAKRDHGLSLPVLRKDFIIDEYQVVESKSWGADVILLIASCLTPEEVEQLAHKARELKMEVLLEIHNENEIGHICEEIDLVGVNNRDLKTFSVDISRSIDLAPKIPPGKILISESGLNTQEDIILLKDNGFKGFLMGERFMKAEFPGVACEEFIKHLKSHNED